MDNCNDNLIKLIDQIDEDLKTANMLRTFELGLALKVMEDRLWNINPTLATWCNDLQHRILDYYD